MKEYIYRILHIPTGLFYCPVKGRFVDEKTNLSKKGNFYLSEGVAKKVLRESASSSYINKAQVEKYNLEKKGSGRWAYSKAEPQDFKIVKYLLTAQEDEKS